MTYEDHIDGMCDKCEQHPAKHKSPFVYLDKNDKAHEDVSELIGYPEGTCYRQYWLCDSCHNKEYWVKSNKPKDKKESKTKASLIKKVQKLSVAKHSKKDLMKLNGEQLKDIISLKKLLKDKK